MEKEEIEWKQKKEGKTDPTSVSMNECKYANCIKLSAKCLLDYCQSETICEVLLPSHPCSVQPAFKYLFPVSGDNADSVDFDLGTLMVPNAVAMSVGMCLSLHAFISTGKLSQTVLCVAMEIKNCCCKWCWRKLDKIYQILSELQGEELSCFGESWLQQGHPSCHPSWMGVSQQLVHICPGEALGGHCDSPSYEPASVPVARASFSKATYLFFPIQIISSKTIS